jgi:hypothetical protein
MVHCCQQTYWASRFCSTCTCCTATATVVCQVITPCVDRAYIHFCMLTLCLLLASGCWLTAEPRTFGEELCAALLCQPPAAAAAAAVPPAVAPFTPPGFTSPQGLASPAGALSPKSTGGADAGLNTAGGLVTGPALLDLQLQAGRAAKVLGFLLHHNPAGQHRLLALQVSESQGDMLLGRCVRLLSECTRRSGDGAARQVCCSMLRMLVEWCAGCEPAVAALLAPASHLPLLVDLVGKIVPGGDEHTAGEHTCCAALQFGYCVMHVCSTICVFESTRGRSARVTHLCAMLERALHTTRCHLHGGMHLQPVQ